MRTCNSLQHTPYILAEYYKEKYLRCEDAVMQSFYNRRMMMAFALNLTYSSTPSVADKGRIHLMETVQMPVRNAHCRPLTQAELIAHIER